MRGRRPLVVALRALAEPPFTTIFLGLVSTYCIRVSPYINKEGDGEEGSTPSSRLKHPRVRRTPMLVFPSVRRIPRSAVRPCPTYPSAPYKADAGASWAADAEPRAVRYDTTAPCYNGLHTGVQRRATGLAIVAPQENSRAVGTENPTSENAYIRNGGEGGIPSMSVHRNIYTYTLSHGACGAPSYLRDQGEREERAHVSIAFNIKFREVREGALRHTFVSPNALNVKCIHA